LRPVWIEAKLFGPGLGLGLGLVVSGLVLGIGLVLWVFLVILPTFKILLPANSHENYPSNYVRDFHLTLTVLLHYL